MVFLGFLSQVSLPSLQSPSVFCFTPPPPPTSDYNNYSQCTTLLTCSHMHTLWYKHTVAVPFLEGLSIRHHNASWSHLSRHGVSSVGHGYFKSLAELLWLLVVLLPLLWAVCLQLVRSKHLGLHSLEDRATVTAPGGRNAWGNDENMKFQWKCEILAYWISENSPSLLLLELTNFLIFWPYLGWTPSWCLYQ